MAEFYRGKMIQWDNNALFSQNKRIKDIDFGNQPNARDVAAALNDALFYEACKDN